MYSLSMSLRFIFEIFNGSNRMLQAFLVNLFCARWHALSVSWGTCVSQIVCSKRSLGGIFDLTSVPWMPLQGQMERLSVPYWSLFAQMVRCQPTLGAFFLYRLYLLSVPCDLFLCQMVRFKRTSVATLVPDGMLQAYLGSSFRPGWYALVATFGPDGTL